ncbi:MAG: MoaD/ThiS family protein [Planctomycetota bacterium]
MPRIFIPPSLRDLSGGETELQLDGANLRQIIVALDQEYPGFAARLCDGDSLAAGVAVAVDGVFVPRSLLVKVSPNAEVHFLPAIAGG